MRMRFLSSMLLCSLSAAITASCPVSAATPQERELVLKDLGFSMKCPETWVVLDNGTMRSASSASEKIAPAVPAAEGLRDLTRMNGFIISKYPVDHIGQNPTLLVAFCPLPPEAANVDGEKLVQTVKTALAESFIKGVVATVPTTEVVEPPSVLDGNRGVWFTLKANRPSPPNGEKLSDTMLARTYMFLSKDRIILATLSWPASGQESGSKSELSKMVESMKF